MDDNNSVYKAPESDLTVKEKLPAAFIDSGLSSGKLKFIAWLTLFYLMVSLLSYTLSFMSGINPADQLYDISSKLIDLFSTIIFIYLFIKFKMFLNQRFEFSRVDYHINAIIGMAVAMEAISWIIQTQSEVLDAVTISYFALMVSYGIIVILFGKRLLSISVDYRYLTLFAWATIIEGVCIASVFLFLLALPFGVISDLAMALIFFTAAKELNIEKSD